MKNNKEALEAANLKFRKALDRQLSEMEGDLQQWSKNAVIIGGALFAAYAVFRLLSSSDDEVPEGAIVVEKSEVLKQESGLIRLAKDKVTLFMLELAKKSLLELLDRKNPSND